MTGRHNLLVEGKGFPGNSARCVLRPLVTYTMGQGVRGLFLVYFVSLKKIFTRTINTALKLLFWTLKLWGFVVISSVSLWLSIHPPQQQYGKTWTDSPSCLTHHSPLDCTSKLSSCKACGKIFVYQQHLYLFLLRCSMLLWLLTTSVPQTHSKQHLLMFFKTRLPLAPAPRALQKYPSEMCYHVLAAPTKASELYWSLSTLQSN